MKLVQTVEAGTSQNIPPSSTYQIRLCGNPTRMVASVVYQLGKRLEKKRAKNHLNSLLSHKNIPFISSFLLWRDLRCKIPTNDKLTNFGIEPSTCVVVLTGQVWIPQSIVSAQENLQHQFGAVLLLLHACCQTIPPCRPLSSNGGLPGQEMQHIRNYYKPHLHSFVRTFGRTDVQPSMEGKNQPQRSQICNLQGKLQDA